MALLPRPSDTHVSKGPHGHTTIGGELSAHEVQQRAARCLDCFGDLHRAVWLPLREVLAQVASDPLRWLRALQRFRIHKTKALRRRELTHRAHVLRRPHTLDSCL